MSVSLQYADTVAAELVSEAGKVGALARAYQQVRKAERSPVTPRQLEIFSFVEKYIDEKLFAPSLEEIARHFGYSSLASVHEHLTTLERKGWIKRAFNETRSITIIESRAAQ